MTSLRFVIGALALIALSACTDPNRFGNGTNNVNGPGPNGPGAVTDGALADPSNPASPAYFAQTVGDRILFEVDQSTLSPAAQAILARQAEWLLANPEYTATIEGHADEQGTRVYNFNLGERRANSVREYLISRGVGAGRLTTISYGKERPLEICSNEACYTKNRRAVTVLAAGGFS
jgi:peptidoglycan-associated lipoprotein